MGGTTPTLSQLSQFLVSMVITCWRSLPTWAGGRNLRLRGRVTNMNLRLSLIVLTTSSPLPDLLTSPSVCHSRMYTRLEVLEQSQLVVLRLARSILVWLLPLHPMAQPLRSNPWRCTMKLLLRPTLETTLVSTLRTSLLRTLGEVLLHLTPRMTQPRKQRASWPRSSSLTTLVRSRLDIPLSSIAILLILPANFLSSRPRLTGVQVRN